MPSELVPKENQPGLPPILAGNATPDMRQRVGQFFSSVASLFESWVTRRKSAHTQRAYREDIMSFVQFLGIEWPDQATAMLSVSVRDVLAFRELLLEKNAAPKTINRRISSLSSFYKYLAARPRPRSACPSRFPIPPTPSSSPASPPTRARKPARSPPRGRGN